MRKILFLSLLLAVVLPAAAQRVDSKLTHYRLVGVDRVITDAQGRRVPAHAAGKLAYIAIYNPAGTLCWVEYVARNHRDLDDARQDTSPGVVFHEKAFARREVVEAAAKAAGFTNVDLGKFFVRVP